MICMTKACIDKYFSFFHVVFCSYETSKNDPFLHLSCASSGIERGHVSVHFFGLGLRLNDNKFEIKIA